MWATENRMTLGTWNVSNLCRSGSLEAAVWAIENGMTFGTWNVSNLCRSGSLEAAERNSRHEQSEKSVAPPTSFLDPSHC